MSAGSAHDAAVRTIGLLFGVAAIVFGLLNLGGITGQAAAVPAWWTIAGVAALVGLPVLLGAASAWAPMRWLRAIALATAGAAVLALASVCVVFPRASTAATSPWPLQLTALGTTAAALALPARLVTADVIVTAALTTAGRLATGGPGLGLIPVQDGLYVLLFCAVFAALAVGARAAARSVDAAARSAVAVAATTADERVRVQERARVDALVHDHVLSTLLVAARAPQSTPELERDAEEAVGLLRGLAAPTDESATVDAAALLDRMRSTLTLLAPGADFTGEIEDAGFLIPADAARALVGAVGEAVRNQRLHAPGAELAVRMVQAGRRVEIAVVDDGPGFVLGQVPRDRLGVRGSIVGRTRAVGGSAEVRSRVGLGTAVHLRWPA